MNVFKTALALGLTLAVGLIAADASAQTVSGGREAPSGRGYNYSATKTGNTTTGSVQTNGGYGATVSHTGGVNAYGARAGTTTVTTNNGTSMTTKSGYAHGVAGGTVAVTSPTGQTVHAGGAVYVPH